MTANSPMTDSLQDVVAELNGKANTAYINYIRTMQQDDCLGVDHKAERGLLRKKNVDEFMRAAEFLGAHRALTEAAARLSALAASVWTDELCIEFLRIAFRHVNIQGDIEFNDIRMGIKRANALSPGRSGEVAPKLREMDYLEEQDDRDLEDWLGGRS